MTDDEVRAIKDECIAYTHGSGPLKRVLEFMVAKELVDTNLDWSQPVQFKFEVKDNGRVELWMRSIYND